MSTPNSIDEDLFDSIHFLQTQNMTKSDLKISVFINKTKPY